MDATPIHCDCGKFQGRIDHLAKNALGRIVCYCDDCQTYATLIGRGDLMDNAGGTEIIPVYPAKFRITSGSEFLKCVQLSPTGLHRWLTTCCSTPIGNMRPKVPWLGLVRRIFDNPETDLGPIRFGIQGRFARGPLPQNTSKTMSFKSIRYATPFLLKGFLLGRAEPSPFRAVPAAPVVIPATERAKVRHALGFSDH